MAIGSVVIWTPSDPMTPTRLSGPEKRYIQQTIPQTVERDRDMDRVRGRMHGICHSYANTSTLIAATVRGAARPVIGQGADPGRVSRTGPARPTERAVVALIDRTDRAMHTWAHCYAPCQACPLPDRPHDETVSLETWVDCDSQLVDEVVGRSVISGHIGRHIDALNMAQQEAAMGLLDRWDGWWRTGVEPDTLRDVTRRASELQRRLWRVARDLGAHAAPRRQEAS